MGKEQDALLLSSLQVASKNWIGFDWITKAQSWDAASSQNKEAREQSVAARKQLAETTKQFKRSVKSVEQAGSNLGSANTEENVLSTVKAIETLARNCRLTVKAYQEEIDNLTRRCKASESSFSALTHSLGEVPDPAALLAMANDHIQNQRCQLEDLQREKNLLEKKVQQAQQQQQQQKFPKTQETGMSKADLEELMQLRKEVAEYEVEFRSLKNQDITIRKLEAKIAELEKGGEEEFHSKLEKAREELAETEGRRTAEALEREAAMERRVQTLELQLKAEMAGRAATQAHLFEANEGAGEREAAWEAQRHILLDDAERLRVSLYQATKERDELRLKVAALDSGAPPVAVAPSSGGIAVADLLSERMAYEAEVSELADTVNSLREKEVLRDGAMAEERHRLQIKIDALEQEVSAQKSNLDSLETQLADAPSQSMVDNMKRELRILKRLEYNADDLDYADGDQEMTGGSDEPGKDLESVLVAKLRRVEAELVRERNSRVELMEEVRQSHNAISNLERAKVEADKVIVSLEQDLDKAISNSSTTSSKTSANKKHSTIVHEVNPSTLEHVLDPDAPEPQRSRAMATEAPPLVASAAEKAADDHSVASIIMAQRDRLRTRCEVLEAERDSFKKELQVQVDAAESLKTDNTKLFEKMRYLQSYGNQSKSGAIANNYNRSNSRDLDLEALEERYEASVDPFRQFGRTERQRKLKEMSPMERTVFVVAKTVLSTKEMRTFLFFYVLAMHLLVFLTTQHWSAHEDSCSISLAANEQLSHLPPQVLNHSPEEIMQEMSGKAI